MPDTTGNDPPRRQTGTPTRAAQHNRSAVAGDPDQRVDGLLPSLDSGLTLLDIEADRNIPVVHALVCDHLLETGGPAFWVDAQGYATTATLARIAPSRRLLDRIHVARGFTAYQHFSALADLPAAVNAHVKATTTTDAFHQPDDGADPTVVDDYTPRFFVGPRDPEADIDLTRLRRFYERHPDMVDTEVVERRPGFRREPEHLLAVDAGHIDRITSLARQARQLDAYPVSELACYNVDFTRGFRYCLERGIDPTAEADLTALSLSVPVTETVGDAYETMTVAGDTVTGTPATILDAVTTAVERRDPDVLVCSTGEIVPTLHDMAAQAGRDEFTLSRWPDLHYQQLAGQSTYTSYGRVGHSPARYNVPGRAIIDESATFLYDETNLDGVLDLVGRSHKPAQELAWASIGTVLTAIQIREATARGVLVPWNAWRHELFKPMATLHDADRGGFIFAPDTGFHEDVHELDFSSLYPNIICTRNVSPDVTAVSATVTARTYPASTTRSATSGGISSTCSNRSSTTGMRSRRPSARSAKRTIPTRRD